MDGVTSTLKLNLLETSYFAEVNPVTPYRSNGEQEIVISGRALARLDNQPVPLAKLNIVIHANGFERTIPIVTDDHGAFRYAYMPQPGDSGEHRVRVVHPDLSDQPVGAYFVITRLRVPPAEININIPKNYTQSAKVTVIAGEGTTAKNLRLAYRAEDQEGQTLAPGIHVDAGQPLASLGAKASADLPFTIWGDNTAAARATIILRAISDEGEWGLVTVNLILADSVPALWFAPEFLEAGLAFDEVHTETITLGNSWLTDLRDVRLTLLSPDGRPAPEWISLNSASELGDIVVGDERQVTISFAPTTGKVSEGLHSYILRVQSSNNPTTQFRLFLTVTKSGQGDALFKISDIYTGTIDNHQPWLGASRPCGLHPAAGQRVLPLRVGEQLTRDHSRQGATHRPLPGGLFEVANLGGRGGRQRRRL